MILEVVGICNSKYTLPGCANPRYEPAFGGESLGWLSEKKSGIHNSMTSPTPALSIVIPCRNEAESIPLVIPKLIEEVKNRNFEIIVVDDNSTDNSFELLRSYPEIVVVRNPRQLGYGGALKSGFSSSRGSHIAFFDLDRTYNSADLDKLYSEVVDKKLAMVFGNRMAKKNKMPKTRYVGNWLFAALLQLLYWKSIQDVCTGFRVFQRGFVPTVLEIDENGLDFSIAMTVVVLNRKLPFAQVDIQYDERIGESKLSIFFDGFRFLRSIFYHSFRDI